MKPALSRHILAKYSYTNFMKICPVGAELFHAGGRTDRQTDRQTEMTKLIVTIPNFANTPKNHTKEIWSKNEDMPRENGTYDNPFITNMG
jgi:hypothetical protein